MLELSCMAYMASPSLGYEEALEIQLMVNAKLEVVIR